MKLKTGMFKKKEPWVKPFDEKIASRVKKIPTGELDLWADQALVELGRCLSMYGRSRDSSYLKEALTGVEAVHAIIDELNNRMTKL
jgi:hypothetical protein